jgi:hypothetical protein
VEVCASLGAIHLNGLASSPLQLASFITPEPRMRLSQFHLATVKEVPADAEIASHRLMLRAGMIRRLASGLYTWSPLGLRVLRKVEKVVREEMDRAGNRSSVTAPRMRK